MHELSLVQEIIRRVNLQREHDHFSRVKAIEVVCGRHSCLSEEHIQFSFDLAAKSSCMEGAKLKLIRSPARYRCASCGAEFESEREEDLRCCSCNSADAVSAINQEIYIRALEVE